MVVDQVKLADIIISGYEESGKSISYLKNVARKVSETLDRWRLYMAVLLSHPLSSSDVCIDGTPIARLI